MKKYIKIVAPILVLVMVFHIYAIPASATYTHRQVLDKNEKRYTESVDVDGNEYIYEYDYSTDGNRTIQVFSTTTGETDIIVYDLVGSTIFMNDELVAIVKTSAFKTTATEFTEMGWVYLASNSIYISWAKGVTATGVAGIITLALGILGVEYVLLQMGTSTLGIIAGASIGGTLDFTYYEWQPVFYPYQLMYNFTFTASTGDSYGPYSIVVAYD